MTILRHRRRRLRHLATLLAALILASAAAAEHGAYWARTGPETGRVEMERVRRRVVGPGSSPPKCRWRCGKCRPCKAVRVTIHPGISVPLDYYPEAWRCKCGNKLFIP